MTLGKITKSLQIDNAWGHFTDIIITIDFDEIWQKYSKD